MEQADPEEVTGLALSFVCIIQKSKIYYVLRNRRRICGGGEDREGTGESSPYLEMLVCGRAED